MQLNLDGDAGSLQLFASGVVGGGPQNLDSVLCSDSDPEWRIRARCSVP
jgi:hypothetical protein